MAIDPDEISDALELVAGTRLRSGCIGDRRTASVHDVSVMRKTILLFLESLDPELTVAELREYLDQ